ncbi:D-2-hydroxyacid dehydrogenase [Halanaerobacter jeridensis]|uniref:Glycerate dehydrogenase n=1 Tax=Halanaerobacter jeridensis TaxID=706427 RepID=A0A938XPN7_9FIRM|nr:D-2-hydroxyacid dehydrogenase [Halanaerobacter jeridensis]MBM7557308.1 glycerate dehydrogenase [Halanaerobacter jeridensis]
MQIVVLDGHALNPGDLSWQDLAELGDLTVYDRTPKDKIKERIAEAEIIFTNKTPLSAEVFRDCPHLKYVGVLATGYNVVDVEAAREHDVVVTNVPGYGTTAVAQHTFALLLEMCNHVAEHNQAVKSGEWSQAPDFCFWTSPVTELVDKNIGIIGYGSIGQKSGELAQAFGMNVLAYEPGLTQEETPEEVEAVTLEELWAKADVITLHCPLFDETKKIINEETISQMKDDVLIINTARGKLINEQDLAAALNQGRVAGAAVDVLAKEPAQMDNPLLNADNTIVTPHIAWAAQESRQRLMDIAVNNLVQFLDGDPINIVN